MSRSRAGGRIAAFDYLRVFVIFLVIVHHAVMAYCTGGEAAHGGSYTNGSAPVVDTVAWPGFNLIVQWNDGFFMPLMFLLAGLFVRPSLARKGLGRYLADRALRLGVPLLIGVATVIPLAYYATYLQAGGSGGFGTFWAHMVTKGPWPSGPLWFLGALLVFDLATVLVLSRVNVRRLTAAWDRLTPGRQFLLFFALATLAYLPARVLIGGSFWLTAGPFGIQASRVGLYGFFFVAGAIVGADRVAASLDRYWLRWPVLAVLATALLVAADHRSLPDWVDGGVTMVFATAMAVGLLALAIRFGRRHTVIGDSLSANAYGIYVVHWPIVLWVQLALVPTPLGAVTKGLLATLVGFGLSWLASAVLRAVPGVSRVL
ncbi:MAG: acyltransferase [Proteobacteria bacterium]|nr:acyltransferase [Pseudomonadota bacterium]